MRSPTWLFVLALPLLVFGCTDDGAPADTSESSGDGDGDGDTATESGTTGDGDGDTGPNCTLGGFNCECLPDDKCFPELACIDGVCTYSECPAGYDGCPCVDGACNDDLFCIEDTCGCLPGSLGCKCDAGACEGELACIDEACWVMSPYANCGWFPGSEWYFCGSNIAHPDFPVDCPVGLVMGEPCPPELTFVGCCDMTGTWWCQDGMISFMSCE